MRSSDVVVNAWEGKGIGRVIRGVLTSWHWRGGATSTSSSSILTSDIIAQLYPPHISRKSVAEKSKTVFNSTVWSIPTGKGETADAREKVWAWMGLESVQPFFAEKKHRRKGLAFVVAEEAACNSEARPLTAEACRVLDSITDDVVDARLLQLYLQVMFAGELLDSEFIRTELEVIRSEITEVEAEEVEAGDADDVEAEEVEAGDADVVEAEEVETGGADVVEAEEVEVGDADVVEAEEVELEAGDAEDVKVGDVTEQAAGVAEEGAEEGLENEAVGVAGEDDVDVDIVGGGPPATSELPAKRVVKKQGAEEMAGEDEMGVNILGGGPLATSGLAEGGPGSTVYVCGMPVWFYVVRINMSSCSAVRERNSLTGYSCLGRGGWELTLGIEAAHPNGWRSGSQKKLRGSLRCFSLFYS